MRQRNIGRLVQREDAAENTLALRMVRLCGWAESRWIGWRGRNY